MIILTDEILKNSSNFSNIMQHEKSIVSLAVKSQKILKNLLLDAMQRFASSTTNVDSNTTDNVIKLLNDFKASLDLSNKNISSLKDLLKQFDVLENLNDLDMPSITENINTFNITYIKINESVLNNTLQIEQTLNSTLPFSEFVFSNTTETDLEVTPKDEISPNYNVETLNTKLIKQDDYSNNLENTLLVSEIKGKVILPYTLSSLEDKLKNNPDKYSSIEDIIEKEYVMPYALFKNPVIARFKEAFKLMRVKEKQSIKKSFDLGMELLFNYNLHPAIISACKNLDELDIYLDYLENNETQKFDIFNIKYEVLPTLSTKKSE